MSHPIPDGHTANAARATPQQHAEPATRPSPRAIDCTPSPDEPAAWRATGRGHPTPGAGTTVGRTLTPDHDRAR